MLQTPYSHAGCGPPGLHAILRLTTADQSGRHVPGLQPPWSVEELSAMTDNQRMTAEQTAKLKQLAKARLRARRAFGPNLTRAESKLRIAMLKAKLKRNGSRR
jgi:hypothetical protein